MRPSVIHVITDLDSGGAEHMLLRLVTTSTRHRHIVVSLSGKGTLAEALRTAGADVLSLRMRRDVPSLGAIFTLARIIRRERPLVLQTWLYHADLIGLLAAKLANFRPVAWNLRCSNMDLSRYRWSTRAVLKILMWLSSWPDVVMTNSAAGRRWHADLGYRPRRWELVPNGIDAKLFHPDAAARARWRQRLNVRERDVLIGMVARRDPMKDHEGMLQAAAEAARRHRNLVFVLAGRGIDRTEPALARLADSVSAPVHLIGECDDPAGLNNALDIAVLSSAFGEGFPNVVTEAMASGVPCIVTDVGDAAAIVGPTGMVVPPRDPRALAEAMATLADDRPLRTRLGDMARYRVEQSYELTTAVTRYEALWQRLGAANKVAQSDPEMSTVDGSDLAPNPKAEARPPRDLPQPVATTVEPIARGAGAKGSALLLKILRRGLPVVVTVAALAVALNRFDRSSLWETAATLRLSTLVIVLFALLLGNLLACVRLKVVAEDLHHPIRFRDAFSATILGQLAGSFFFQVIGQTLARSAVLSRSGVSVPATIVITGYERIVAAVVSLLMALAGAFYLFGHITFDLAGGGYELLEIVAGVATVVAGGAMFAWGTLAKRALGNMAWMHAVAASLRASAISILIQLTTMAAYLAAAVGLSPSTPLFGLVAAIALVMFAASVPISLAGWGLREISAVYALSTIGVPYATSLVVALLIGFSSIAIMAAMALANSLFGGAVPSRIARQASPGVTIPDNAFLDWFIPLFVSSTVFFQIYVPAGIGKVNVNLADSLVLFGGALFVRYLVSRPVMPLTSRIPSIGFLTVLMTAVIVLAFMHGWIVDGWTVWSSTNRLFGWFVLLAYAGTGALLASQADTEGFRVLLSTFVASGLAIVAFELTLLFALAVGVPIPESLLGLRIEGFAQNPNAFAFQILLVIAGIIALRLVGWRHHVSLALAFMAIFFSASRAAEGTLVIVCATALALGYVNIRSVAMPLIGAAVGVLAIFLAGHTISGNSTAHYFATDIYQMTNGDPGQGWNSDRWASLVIGMHMFLAHPLFGAGLGAFVASYAREHGKFLIIHSTPLWLLAETGLAGFAVFAATYFYILRQEIRGSLEKLSDAAGTLLVLSLLAFGVMSQVHDLMYQRAFWFLLGAATFTRQLPLKSFANKGDPKKPQRWLRNSD